MSDKKIVNSNSCEFGYELISVLPYAYHLHQKGLLKKTISGFDTKCFYFFSPEHEEKKIERTWSSVVKMQNEKFPNMKIHRRELDWDLFSPPPMKEFYEDKKIIFEKETIVIFNRYNKEWGKDPINYLDLQTLDKLFSLLSHKYQIVYLNLNHDKRYFDHLKPLDFNESQILKKYPSILTFEKLKIKFSDLSLNEIQCRIFAGCEKYISSNGGQLILSAYFGGENIIFSKKCNELDPNVNSFYGWYHKFGKGVFQHVSTYNDLIDLVYQKWVLNKPLINILIRTSKRPQFFNDCINSVYNQTYKNINIIVGVDNKESYNYVKKEKCRIVEYSQKDFSVPEKPNLPEYGNVFIPNSYMNKLMDECQYGYIMYLDDDDIYSNTKSLSEIVSHINGDNNLLFWKVEFPHRVVPGHSKFRKPPELTEIDTVGFMFPIKYRVDWEPFSNGDFRVAKQLYQKVPIKRYIDKILTKVIRNVKAGRGLQDDKIDNLNYVTQILEKNNKTSEEKKKTPSQELKDSLVQKNITPKLSTIKEGVKKLDEIPKLSEIKPPVNLNDVLEKKKPQIKTEDEKVQITKQPKPINFKLSEIKPTEKKVEPKIEIKKEEKKQVNTVDYSLINKILGSNKPQKINQIPNKEKKPIPNRNEIFELKNDRGVVRANKQIKKSSDTPKLNIKLR
jgi:hypothetical protein